MGGLAFTVVSRYKKGPALTLGLRSKLSVRLRVAGVIEFNEIAR